MAARGAVQCRPFDIRLRAAAHVADQLVSGNAVLLAKLRRVLKLNRVGQRPLGLLSHLRQARLPEDLYDVLPPELHRDQRVAKRAHGNCIREP
jgi:hypothetical protein